MARDHPRRALISACTSSGALYCAFKDSRWKNGEVNDVKGKVTKDLENEEKNTLVQNTYEQILHSMPQTSGLGEQNSTTNRHRLLVDVLIVIFGISAWIGINGIYVQLPLLVSTAPEGWSLPAYMVVVIQAANVGPIIYGLSRKFAPRLCSESAWIWSLLVLGSVTMGLLAFLHDLRTVVNGVDHSIVLLVLVFASALVGCSSSVIFVPYLRNFQESHLVSFFVGEGLSGLLSSAVALVQGVGGNSVCQENTSNSTESQSPIVPMPNFSSRVYFLFIFTVLACSTGAFWLLECLPSVRNQKIPIPVSPTASENSTHLYNTFIPGKVTFTEETSDSELPKNTAASEAAELQAASLRTHSNTKKRYLYILLGLVCLAGNGFLPGIQSYSCLPYGNIAYHLTVTLAHISNPVACVLVLWLPSLNPRGITVVSVLAALPAFHVTWLAFLSPIPPWRNTTHGVIFVVVAWIFLTGFITYAKLSITAIFRREPGANPLFYVGIVTQTGSTAGAVLSFVLINYSNLLVPFTTCVPPG